MWIAIKAKYFGKCRLGLHAIVTPCHYCATKVVTTKRYQPLLHEEMAPSALPRYRGRLTEQLDDPTGVGEIGNDRLSSPTFYHMRNPGRMPKAFHTAQVNASASGAKQVTSISLVGRSRRNGSVPTTCGSNAASFGKTSIRSSTSR